jgi:hypothetical protein
MPHIPGLSVSVVGNSPPQVSNPGVPPHNGERVKLFVRPPGPIQRRLEHFFYEPVKKFSSYSLSYKLSFYKRFAQQISLLQTIYPTNFQFHFGSGHPFFGLLDSNVFNKDTRLQYILREQWKVTFYMNLTKTAVGLNVWRTKGARSERRSTLQYKSLMFTFTYLNYHIITVNSPSPPKILLY